MRLLNKVAILFGLLSVVPLSLHADDNAFFKLGPLELNIPFKTARVAYLYDWNGKRSLVGGETPVVLLWQRFEGTVGAVTSLDGNGSPFVGANIKVGNLLQNYVTLPDYFDIGAHAGRDFNAGAYIYGLKASTKIW